MRSFVLLAAFTFIGLALKAQETPFTRGANFSNWFQSGFDDLVFSRYDSLDFRQAAALGMDVIRVPVDLYAMLKPDFTIDARFYFFFDHAIRWAEAADVWLILDNHTFDPSIDTSPEIETWLRVAWQQLATYYKNRYPKLIFEILNEPHGISDEIWNGIQLRTVAEIRAIDSVRLLIVGGAGWNSIWNLEPMPHYPFENLIFTFHFYDPFLFTHQGANWTSPSLETLSGMPFPFEATRMPAVPSDLAGTWVESGFTHYRTEGTRSKMAEILAIARQFRQQRNVPVFCGEFGVYQPNAPESDRRHWYGVSKTLLEKEQISWTMWDYRGGFGLFNKNSAEHFFHDVDVALVDSLGLIVPIQIPFVVQPLAGTQTLFSNFLHRGFTWHIHTAGGAFSPVHVEHTNPINLALRFQNAGRYAFFGIRFSESNDFSELKNRNAIVSFRIKMTGEAQRLQLRFMNPQERDSDIPWRMSYTLEKQKFNLADEWTDVQISLNEFSETGAWHTNLNQWFEPQGAFDWRNVDQLVWSAEFESLHETSVFVDTIQIIDKNVTSSESENSNPLAFGVKTYPNPFNPTTNFEIRLPVSSSVSIKLFDLSGREIAVLTENAFMQAGVHTVSWNAKGISSGIYIAVIRAGNTAMTKKLAVVK